jgi:DNA-binding response OmpR family regulator
MGLNRPRLVLALEDEDTSSMMAGIFWLKGCDVIKAKSGKDCLEQINKLKSGIDVVITSSEIAVDRNLEFIRNIKKMNIDIKILVIGDENTDKTRILDYGADEYTLKPLSPENAADKVLMLLAREKVADNRSNN